MSDLRQNWLSGRWVMMAANREQRPIQFVAPPAVEDVGPCPFCPGNEAATPATVQVYPAQGPWEVRVIPNKYPAVQSAPTMLGDPSPNDAGTGSELFIGKCNYGRHEVVIESREHVGDFLDVSARAASLAFQAYRDRLLDLSTDPRLNYVQVFKNNGSAAGASIHHVHSQILALQSVPPALRDELEASERWMARHGECLLCRMMSDERISGARLVTETKNLVAFCPFASRFPFEAWIVPRRHASRYETSTDADLEELAEFMRDILSRLRRSHGAIAYNYSLHTAPLRGGTYDHYHWHWEILPRTTNLGGFEWATGMYINSVPPEAAARQLA